MSNQNNNFNNKPKYVKRSPIKAQIDSMVNYPGSKLKAYASIRIYDRFCATGFRVYEDEKGLFVLNPSRKSGDNYQDIFFALNKKDRILVQDAVIKAYTEKMEQAENNNQSESNESTEQSVEPAM